MNEPAVLSKNLRKIDPIKSVSSRWNALIDRRCKDNDRGHPCNRQPSANRRFSLAVNNKNKMTTPNSKTINIFSFLTISISEQDKTFCQQHFYYYYIDSTIIVLFFSTFVITSPFL
jgi:hypothetical protein